MAESWHGPRDAGSIPVSASNNNGFWSPKSALNRRCAIISETACGLDQLPIGGLIKQ